MPVFFAACLRIIDYRYLAGGLADELGHDLDAASHLRPFSEAEQRSHQWYGGGNLQLHANIVCSVTIFFPLPFWPDRFICGKRPQEVAVDEEERGGPTLERP